MFHRLTDSTIARIKNKLDTIYDEIIPETEVFLDGLNQIVEIFLRRGELFETRLHLMK